MPHVSAPLSLKFGATGKTMPLVMFFIFLFPMFAIVLLSLPLFLLIKNKTTGALRWYVLSGVTVANFIALLFIKLFNSLGDKPLGSISLAILASSIYGLMLGTFFWYIGKRQKVG
jgi:hypothetical protein